MEGSLLSERVEVLWRLMVALLENDILECLLRVGLVHTSNAMESVSS